jgi:hypothetical protein
LLAVPALLAFSAGGFSEGARLRAAIAVWAAVAVLALTARRPLPRSGPSRLALACLAGLAAWTTAAVAWSPLHDAGLGDAERVWLYAGYVLLAAALLRGPLLRWVEPALAGGAVVVAAYAIATRLLPDVVPSSRSLRAGARLDQPLTYWNSLGLLMAIALVLLLRLASAPDRPPRLRTPAAALVPIPGLALYLTFSRGSLAALAVGVIVLLALCRDRRTVATTLAGLGCAAAAAAVASRFSAVDSLAGSAVDQRNQGLVVLAAVLVLCAAAAGLQRAIARGAADRIRLRSGVGLAALALAAVLAVGGVVALTRSPSAPPGPPPGGDNSGVQLPSDRARLGTLKTNRYSYWRVAVHGFWEKPLTGVGTHGFQELWLERRKISESVQDAHSLYLETAVELGLIGLLLLFGFLGGAGTALVRMLRAPGGRALAAGWAAASAAFLVHAGIDWDWEMPAATLPFLALAGAALGAADEGSVDGHGREHDQRGLGGHAKAGDPVDQERDHADRGGVGRERPDGLAPPA